ncbi:Islet cell autoantigen 1 [Armadillidium nasatum]|uniref:Islet cell autoantigen 1 n=1 Tax=Armadillidium nasatum TaxID=96803 RepID=A0A5N5TEF5_9CRUS|nr:Islet cell autoantigen 1 [Armadillidium nasatum]
MSNYHGYSGNNFDRWVERNSNTSALGKVQKQFWFTKSAVIRKLGKREDEYIVASDAELDAKIDLFKAIESSTKELQMLLADYQNRICILAQEENTLGRLLKEYGKQDQTRAGKMMLAVGKSLSYTAQQRVALRNPLVRLFQEVDTFQTRAVEDTCHTVEEMEKIRTEYRGALMWMKNISQDFNPDHYQQLEKFREVQTLVKQKKSRFDQMKIKSLQKIELLAASRCNMFSHALILYQNNLITFSDKTAKTLNNVASNFKGYHPYKFHVIKELAEPLAPVENEEDDEKVQELELNDDDKTFFDSEYHDDEKDNASKSLNPAKNRANKYKKEERLSKNSDSLVNLFNDEDSSQLLTFENNDTTSKTVVDENVAETLSSFANVDLMSEEILTEANLSTAEMLKELFESPHHENKEPPKQVLPIFGTEALYNQNASLSHDKASEKLNSNGLSQSNPSSSQLFLPSQLLDFGLSDFNSQLSLEKPNNLPSKAFESQFLWQSPLPSQQKRTNANLPLNKDLKGANESVSSLSKQDKNKLDWYKVFQDIDPLADPGNAIFGKGFRDKKC